MTTLTKSMERLTSASIKKNALAVVEAAQSTYGDFFGFYGEVPANAGNATLLEMADLTSATSGVLNKIFGRSLWAQLNTKHQLYSALPKVQVRKGIPYGWRAKTAFASSGKGGQTEGTLPTAVVSSYFQVAPTIKEHSTQMRVSGLQQDLAEGPDDAYGMLADIVAELAIEHGREFERAITTDTGTAAGVNLESLDRVTNDDSQRGTTGLGANTCDIYGIARASNTWANSVLKAYAAATTMSTKDMDGILRDVHKFGGFTEAIFTEWTTWAALSQLLEPRGRFGMGFEAKKGPMLNEAESPEGQAISTFVNDYQGRIIIPSDQVVVDTNGVGRMYFGDIGNPEGLDKPRLGIDVLRPTQMYLAGERSGTTPQSINFVGDSVLAVTRHELGCRFFKAQGQYRNIASP